MAIEQQPSDLPDEEQTALLRATERGLHLYDTRLISLLEPDQNGKVVAIDPESGDYVVATTAAQARLELRRRHRGAFAVTRTIGPEVRQDLARRLSDPQRIRH